MEVCEVCGAFLIVGDAQSRVDDHLMGKQHMGYAKIKSTVEELKVTGILVVQSLFQKNEMFCSVFKLSYRFIKVNLSALALRRNCVAALKSPQVKHLH